ANKMFRDQVRVAASWFAGKHDIRFGYEGVKGGEKSRVWTVSGMRANFNNGVPTSVNTYALPITNDNTSSGKDIPNQFENWSIDKGAYLQDRFTATRRLVINAGVRYEMNSSYEPATCRPDTVFAGAGQCFDKVQAPSFKDASPRFNMVYDLRGDGKTALKLAANRYNQPINIQIIARLNPVSTTSDQRPWIVCAGGQTSGCDLNGDRLPQVNELGPSNGFVFAGVNSRYAGDLRRPISNEYTAEVQQQLPMSMVLSLGYTHRETRRNIGQRNTAIDPSAWIGPQTISEATAANAGYSGQAVVTVWGRPSTASANLFFNSPQSDTTYDGADVTVNKRMSSHFSLTSGATYGQTKRATAAVGAAAAAADLNNPNVVNNPYFAGGITGGDRPWSYRLSGVLDLPFAFQLSGTGIVQAGNTEQTTVLVLNSEANLGSGVQNLAVNVSPVGGVRYPVLKQVDMSIRRNFRYSGKSFSPRLDVFNAANNATIGTWVTQLGPNYHVPSTIQRGRAMKFSISAEF
ncbi:MAG TPA: TonB-dependent receptor, partial [Gemmatimonadaceae bacterium]|nr:TonB-dependent receptor [Gemmatimonadaceae bacterium]